MARFPCPTFKALLLDLLRPLWSFHILGLIRIRGRIQTQRLLQAL